jgi:tRNA U34 2-thiouridine synthase MnmA/TrmU
LLKCRLEFSERFDKPNKSDTYSNITSNTNVATVKLQKPTKGIAEGQSAVFYKKIGNDVVCLGGGIITFS